MAHTNQTPNYDLPQFIGSDKPAWLVDFNQAMTAIDTAMKANQTSAGNAAQAATQAQTSADTANSAATAAGATAQSALLTANQTAADLLTLQNKINNLEGKTVKWSNPTVIFSDLTSERTWTADAAGLALAFNNPSATTPAARGYIRDTTDPNNSYSVAQLNSPTGGFAVGAAFPVIAGHQYNVLPTSPSKINIVFFPINLN